MFLTYKFRIKDATSRKRLERHARAVNFVWNYCCEVQRKAEDNWKAGRVSRWPSHFDLTMLCTGISVELGISAETIGAVCKQFATSRSAAGGSPSFRASSGSRRALGWLPYRGRTVKVSAGKVIWYKQAFRFWQSRELDGPIKSGAFVQEAGGRWYVTFQCEIEGRRPTGVGAVGVDLGLKTLATCSNGEVVPALKFYRKYESALAVAQRAGNKRRAKAVHAKIANARRDQTHKATTKIARENSLIVVGNVSAAKLKKTRMAKSVSDAGWYAFRKQLEYKARRHQAVYIEVDERFTSQTCSDCGVIGGPKGIAGLGVRRWVCCCGASHDRDVNAAKNILRVGQERLPPAVEIAA